MDQTQETLPCMSHQEYQSSFPVPMASGKQRASAAAVRNKAQAEGKTAVIDQLESRNPGPPLSREDSDHSQVLPSLTVTSLKGTSRNGATRSWVKLYRSAMQRLMGNGALWHRAMGVF